MKVFQIHVSNLYSFELFLLSLCDATIFAHRAQNSHQYLYILYTVQREWLAAGKFGKFNELSVIYQTKTVKILLTINTHPYGHINSFANFFMPATFA